MNIHSAQNVGKVLIRREKSSWPHLERFGEHMQNLRKKLPWMAASEARRIFPTNPDLADILGRMDLGFDKFDLFNCWNQYFRMSRSPYPQIPRFLDFQVPTRDSLLYGCLVLYCGVCTFVPDIP